MTSVGWSVCLLVRFCEHKDLRKVIILLQVMVAVISSSTSLNVCLIIRVCDCKDLRRVINLL